MKLDAVRKLSQGAAETLLTFLEARRRGDRDLVFRHLTDRARGEQGQPDHAWLLPTFIPILQPRHIPPGLAMFHLQPNGTLISISYARSISFPLPDSPLREGPYFSVAAGGFNPQPFGSPEQVEVRGVKATLSALDDPKRGHLVGLIWEEPGRWVMDGSRVLPRVLYAIQSVGFAEEEVVRVAESMAPVDVNTR